MYIYEKKFKVLTFWVLSQLMVNSHSE